MVLINIVQKPFKSVNMKEKTSLSGIRTLDYIIQLFTEPKLSFKSKNGFNKKCSETNCASDVKVYNLFWKTWLTLIHLSNLFSKYWMKGNFWLMLFLSCVYVVVCHNKDAEYKTISIFIPLLFPPWVEISLRGDNFIYWRLYSNGNLVSRKILELFFCKPLTIGS